MRVLVLHSRYLSGTSSGENRVVEDEVELLRSAGHEVRLWAPSPEDAGGTSRLRLGARAVWSRPAVREVERLAAELRPEVVHAHNLYPMLSPAVLRTAAAPVVVTLHNYRLLCLPATFLRNERTCEDCLGALPWRGVVHRCYRGSAAGSAALAASLGVHRRAGTFRHVAAFLAVSEFVRQKHVEAGMDAARIRVKPNFVAPMPRREGPGRDFLYLGRLSAEKGLDRLVGRWREMPGRLRAIQSNRPRSAASGRSRNPRQKTPRWAAASQAQCSSSHRVASFSRMAVMAWGRVKCMGRSRTGLAAFMTRSPFRAPPSGPRGAHPEHGTGSALRACGPTRRARTGPSA